MSMPIRVIKVLHNFNPLTVADGGLDKLNNLEDEGVADNPPSFTCELEGIIEEELLFLSLLKCADCVLYFPWSEFGNWVGFCSAKTKSVNIKSISNHHQSYLKCWIWPFHPESVKLWLNLIRLHEVRTATNLALRSRWPLIRSCRIVSNSFSIREIICIVVATFFSSIWCRDMPYRVCWNCI